MTIPNIIGRWMATAVFMVGSGPPVTWAAESSGAPTTTPPGVTLVEVVRELSTSSDQVLWIRVGGEDGSTLLLSQRDSPGVSRCLDACAVEFPPLLAPSDAEPFDDWSLVQRSDGRKQWAYLSHPLYSWTAEQEPGEVATNVGLSETAGLKTAEGRVRVSSLLPPAGWEVARFDPAASMAVPVGVEVAALAAAQAVVLTDFEGHTLYAFDGDATKDGQLCSEASCETRWVPITAPALARDVGRFTIVSRSDGSRQWAHRAKPLYRFQGDLLPGDANGRGVDERWSVAVLTKNFRPVEVDVRRLAGYGDTLALGGRTLYVGSAFEKYWGGRNLRDSFKVAYSHGKRLGGNACVDPECLQSWRPLQAETGAQSRGFWEVITRGDGTRQWAYKGFALYTYAGDVAPGQNRGQATYTFVDPEGRSVSRERAAMLANIGNAGGGAGVYWNIAKP